MEERREYGSVVHYVFRTLLAGIELTDEYTLVKICGLRCLLNILPHYFTCAVRLLKVARPLQARLVHNGNRLIEASNGQPLEARTNPSALVALPSLGIFFWHP